MNRPSPVLPCTYLKAQQGNRLSVRSISMQDWRGRWASRTMPLSILARTRYAWSSMIRLGRAPLPRYVEKSLCRLGEGLAQTEAISEEGFRRTVEALRRFRAVADAMGVARIDATATEAIRRASNGPALVAAIKETSGLEVRILQGEEEARYSALGVISGFFRPVGLVGDMGGGSLEVAEALDDHVGDIGQACRWELCLSRHCCEMVPAKPNGRSTSC